VKELTLKTANNKGSTNHLMSAFKLIKDLIKKVKVQDTEDSVRQEANQDEQEELITIKGKKEVLENLVIRPNIVGKKTIGNLEIHQNGVRFASQKGHMVDITFSNIKHAFF
jgi:nucleosome binding factor SPN SPT16 subunit